MKSLPKRIGLGVIAVYRALFSVFTYGSCRYYPSCSEYAKWQLETNSFAFALWASLTRIGRCNQLYPGGIDYPVVAFHPEKTVNCYTRTSGKIELFNIKYWLVPAKRKGGRQYVYVVKNFNYME